MAATTWRGHFLRRGPTTAHTIGACRPARFIATSRARMPGTVATVTSTSGTVSNTSHTHARSVVSWPRFQLVSMTVNAVDVGDGTGIWLGCSTAVVVRSITTCPLVPWRQPWSSTPSSALAAPARPLACGLQHSTTRAGICAAVAIANATVDAPTRPEAPATTTTWPVGTHLAGAELAKAELAGTHVSGNGAGAAGCWRRNCPSWTAAHARCSSSTDTAARTALMRTHRPACGCEAEAPPGAHRVPAGPVQSWPVAQV